jgi:hypothetical protein
LHLLSGLPLALLPRGLGLISLLIWVCHKITSLSISIRIIDNYCGADATIQRHSSRRIVALRHPLLGNDRFGSNGQFFTRAVEIFDSSQVINIINFGISSGMPQRSFLTAPYRSDYRKLSKYTLQLARASLYARGGLFATQRLPQYAKPFVVSGYCLPLWAPNLPI